MSRPSGESGARRPRLRRVAGELRYTLALRVLPPRVALFQWRARRVARQSRERFSLTSATRPPDLAVLLALARGRQRVVELGTGMGWTAISIAMAGPECEVTTYDPAGYPERERYLALAGRHVLQRIRFAGIPGSAGPQDGEPVDLLYIDSSHEREQTVAEVRAWWGALRRGALVVFDDFTHPDFPGVREAIDELGLDGEQRGTLFIHEVNR